MPCLLYQNRVVFNRHRYLNELLHTMHLIKWSMHFVHI